MYNFGLNYNSPTSKKSCIAWRIRILSPRRATSAILSCLDISSFRSSETALSFPFPARFGIALTAVFFLSTFGDDGPASSSSSSDSTTLFALFLFGSSSPNRPFPSHKHFVFLPRHLAQTRSAAPIMHAVSPRFNEAQ